MGGPAVVSPDSCACITTESRRVCEDHEQRVATTGGIAQQHFQARLLLVLLLLLILRIC